MLIPNVLELVGHPGTAPSIASVVKSAAASAGDGFMISVTLERETNTSEAGLSIYAEGAVALGSGPGMPPPLAMRGSFLSGGPTSFTIETHSEWHPVSGVAIPALFGTVTFDTNGTVSVEVAHSPIAHLVIFPDLLSWQDLQITLAIDDFDPKQWSKSDNNQSAVVRVSAAGAFLIGGEGGFSADVKGTLDTGAGSATLFFSHHGGWSPIAALSDYLSTPAFDGYANFGVDGVSLDLGATIRLKQPISLVPGFLTLMGSTDNRREAGPEISVAMQCQTNCSEAEFSVSFGAGVRLGSASNALPIITVLGTVRQCGSSTVSVSTSDEWAPMPGVFEDFRIPRLFGTMTFSESGAVITTITHSPIDVSFGGVIEFRGMQATVHAVFASNASHSAGSAQNRCPPMAMAPSPPPADQRQLQLNVGGEMLLNMINGVDPLIVTYQGTFDTATQVRNMQYPAHACLHVNMQFLALLSNPARIDQNPSFLAALLVVQAMSLTLEHGGGWCPVPGVAFCPPAIPAGLFTLNPSAGGQGRRLTAFSSSPYMSFSLFQAIDSPIPLFSPALLLSRGSMGEDLNLGPTFEVTLAKPTRRSASELSIGFHGGICLHLDASPRCLDISMTADFGPQASNKVVFTGLTLAGKYQLGDISPLAAVLPRGMKNLVVIRGSVEKPIVLSCTMSALQTRFEMEATLAFYPPSFLGMGAIELGLRAYGQLEQGKPPCGVFGTRDPIVVSLPGGISLPPLLLYVSQPCGAGRRLDEMELVAPFRDLRRSRTETVKPRGVRHLLSQNQLKVTLPSGAEVGVPPGLTLMTDGPSLLPEICSDSMVIGLSLVNPTAGRIEAACVGMNLKMLHKKPLMLPSINFLKLTEIALFAEIAAGPPPLIEFGLTASFEFATGRSYCETNSDPNSYSSEAYPVWDSSECVRAELTVAIGQDAARTTIMISARTSGAWFDPLGLRNFAFVNPNFEVDVAFTRTVPPVPTLKKLAFGAALFWKRDPGNNWNNWPVALRYKTDGWPAANIDFARYKMSTLQAYFLYEEWHSQFADRE